MSWRRPVHTFEQTYVHVQGDVRAVQQRHANLHAVLRMLGSARLGRGARAGADPGWGGARLASFSALRHIVSELEAR